MGRECHGFSMSPIASPSLFLSKVRKEEPQVSLSSGFYSLLIPIPPPHRTPWTEGNGWSTQASKTARSPARNWGTFGGAFSRHRVQRVLVTFIQRAMAEEPVWGYLVSAKFPANRENNRVFPLFSVSNAKIGANIPDYSMRYWEFPSPKE